MTATLLKHVAVKMMHYANKQRQKVTILNNCQLQCLRLACGTVKNIVKVHCNLRLIDNIEQIGLSDANIEWSSDEDLD